MRLSFTGEVVYWRGPSPYYFVEVPEPVSELIAAESSQLTYGWGCIPARARIAETDFTTALFPKDDLYMLPVKAAVRTHLGVDVGDELAVVMELGPA